MDVRFPETGQVRSVVNHEGFVARALLIDGRRAKTLPVEVYAGNKVEPGNFGYIAGTATHVTSGLEHCMLLALFDQQNRLGAAGHFEIFATNDPLPQAQNSLNEFIDNLEDMKRTLGLMGANVRKLQGFCVFGLPGGGIIAPVIDILQVLHNAGIAVPHATLCRDGDNVYQSFLADGAVSYYLDGSSKTHRIFEAKAEPVDLAPGILRYAEDTLAYFDGLCKDCGRFEFLGSALPYLAVKYFDRPEVFFTYAMRAVDEGSERPAQSQDPKRETIGQYFRGLVRS